jgi:hypothetical protein
MLLRQYDINCRIAEILMCRCPWPMWWLSGLSNSHFGRGHEAKDLVLKERSASRWLSQSTPERQHIGQPCAVRAILGTAGLVFTE